VNIVNERMLAEERARILANQNRAEEERLARLRLQEEERQRQAVRQEQERQQLAQLERERLERERLAAEREQSRIQAELERNRRQLAERQGTGFTGTPAPAKTETAGSFPWWLLGLLLLQ
jgi:hypothetical protein